MTHGESLGQLIFTVLAVAIDCIVFVSSFFSVTAIDNS